MYIYVFTYMLMYIYIYIYNIIAFNDLHILSVMFLFCSCLGYVFRYENVASATIRYAAAQRIVVMDGCTHVHRRRRSLWPRGLLLQNRLVSGNMPRHVPALVSVLTWTSQPPSGALLSHSYATTCQNMPDYIKYTK